MRTTLAFIALASVLCAQTHKSKPTKTVNAAETSRTGDSVWAATSGGGTWTTCRWAANGGITCQSERKARALYVASVKQVDASAKLLVKSALAPPNYLALAHEIEMESASSDEAQMLETLFHNGVKVYDFEHVDAYLSQQAEKLGPNVEWVWKPLRKKDQRLLQDTGWKSDMGTIVAQLYGRKIPESAMLVAAKVLSEMPDAMLLVSDYETRRPDPFLAVTTPRLAAAGKLWVVARWDEPGFGSEPESVTPPNVTQ